MLIPICNERLPVRLQINVINAKYLPVMNRGINSTDAFVEIRYLETVEKTEVVTSLDPVWNSEPYVFDTDEKEIAEECIQFRVMDHDTYSANDAIGRVIIDGNIFIQRMRATRVENLEETVTLKIYDTIYGIRGDLTVKIQIQLLMETNYSNYVQIFTGANIPGHLRIAEIIGLVDNIRCEKDPDYEWLDRIRTPRATNEARQNAIRATLREAAISLAFKASKLGANIILGYIEYVDMEGSSSDLLTCRVLGTAVKVVGRDVVPLPYPKPLKPILTIEKVPHDRQVGLGALVTARSIQVLDEDEDPEAVRKTYWDSLRTEIYQQGRSIGANLIIAYSESFTVNEGVALLTCTGTAVVLSDGSEIPHQNSFDNSLRNSPVVFRDSQEKEIKEKKPLFKLQFQTPESREKRADSTPREFRCNQFHYPQENAPSRMTKCFPCAYCKNGLVAEFLLATIPCPSPQYYIGPRNFIQVSVCKKLTSDPHETTDYATDIGNALPFSDHELIGNLMNEAKAIYPTSNAIFNIQMTNAICDDTLICVATGILVRLLVVQKSDLSSPSITNVLSFSSLQRQHDARRFSWGTVRDAIRFKPSVQSNLTLKILNLKQTQADEGIATSAKGRLRLNTIVDKVRRKQQREYVSHVVFERHLSLSIGIHENQCAGNASSIAGVHLSSNLYPHFVNKDSIENCVAVARFSDVYVREDLTTAVKDSTSVDGFVTNALEERITSIKSVMSLCGANSVVANMRLQCPQFNVLKEHAHIIILVSFDLYNMP
ncbi:unnamed protein product [Caenorhabditis bovis]|uniref:C2 domain-containing protein n=1 Tax=Caenorhabditis bovis TaxID=2654633 RepID=A0A8S1E9M6_9PELO|nr:unnamed protein product [Caenorhabditis bovis]